MTKPPKIWKQIVTVFAVTLAGYIAVFNWIEHRRVKNGPWEVTFQNISGQLELQIDQGALGIREVRLQIANAPVTTNLTETIQFTAGRQVPFDVPFGRCVFLDPLFLPGKVVLEIAHHEVQMMPRMLIVDGTEHPWATTQRLTLRPARRDEPAK